MKMQALAALIALMPLLAACGPAQVTETLGENRYRIASYQPNWSMLKSEADYILSLLSEKKCPGGFNTLREYQEKGPGYPIFNWEIECLQDGDKQADKMVVSTGPSAMAPAPMVARPMPVVNQPMPVVKRPPLYRNAYDLRGFKLGMTLDEFRAMRHPDAAKYSSLTILCTGDPGVEKVGGGWDLAVSGAIAKAGVIRCNHFRPSIIETLARQGARDQANLDVAGVGVYQTFEFAPAPADGVPRLFRIAIQSNMQSWDQFWSAYKERFGKPTALKTEKVQNKMGATFDKVTATWANKESSITLEQRTTAIDHMGITYLLNDIAAHVAKQVEAVEGKPSSKL